MRGGWNRALAVKKGLFYAALIAVFIMAVLPSGGMLFGFNINDKILHAVTFMVLFFLMEGAYGGLTRLVMSAYLMAYGASIETVQYFLPYREFSMLDIVANGTGLLVYFLIRKASVRFLSSGKSAR